MSTENAESSQPTPPTEATPEAPPAQVASAAQPPQAAQPREEQQEDAALREEAAQTLMRHEEQARTVRNSPALAELGAEAAQRMLTAQLAATQAAGERAQDLRSAAAEAEVAAEKLADAAEKLEEAQPSVWGALAEGALWALGLLGTAFAVVKVVDVLTRPKPAAPRERGTEDAKCEEAPRSGGTPEPAAS